MKTGALFWMLAIGVMWLVRAAGPRVEIIPDNEPPFRSVRQ